MMIGILDFGFICFGDVIDVVGVRIVGIACNLYLLPLYFRLDLRLVEGVVGVFGVAVLKVVLVVVFVVAVSS